jgi:translation initiation factor IF-2
MSKIRIYELAKELGVENKVVISKAKELGMQGKDSHSNSLDADEADQLRRAIIRQAIGTAKAEVVTRRVDRATGAAEAIVESRSGNVIRRRRQVEEPTPEPEPQAAHAAEAPAETAPEESESPVEEAAAAEAAETAEPAEAVEADTAQAAGSPAGASAAEAAQPEAGGEESKKTVGPKVLGRIALPQKKVARPQAEARRTTAGTAAVAISFEPAAEPTEEEGERRKEGGKRKSRRREISRTDLLDYEGRDARRGPRRGSTAAREEKRQAEPARPMAASKKIIKMDESITVGELARQMSMKAGDVIAKLIDLGIMATINQAVDNDTAGIIASEYGYMIESTGFKESDILSVDAAEDVAQAAPRPPVVTVMGHVDHGKTSLLDSIRHASVAEKEQGGITQHIGAYQVKLDDGRLISFIDTPGHAAFTSMRARGAQVTDIVILVVAADDGVMPQTVEAINHAKAAGVPIIVAVNKIDKPDANPDKVKQQLVEHGLQPEDWGGDTMFFPVSATKKTGLKELLEGVLLQAEVKELKANPAAKAKGAIIEARQDRGRGAVATVLVQKGTLHVGDIFISGAEYGRVRSMSGDSGARLESAGPSTPVEITGLTSVPMAGDDFAVVETEAQAREISQNRLAKKQAKEQRALATGPISLEEFARRAYGRRRAECDSKGRRAWFGRSGARFAREAHHREGEGARASRRRGRSERKRRAARHRRKGDYRRFRREIRAARARRRGTRGRGCALLPHHLRTDRRREEGHGRAPRTDSRGSAARPRGGARNVRRSQSRHDCRMFRHRGTRPPERQRAPSTRHPCNSRGQDAEPSPLQRRRARSAERLRVRHRHRRIQRRQGGRRH